MTTHTYTTELAWEGSTGQGYRAYTRDHRADAAPAETALQLSADPAFRGDAARLNPEQLVVVAASSCQLLSFLAVAARRGIDVLEYTDRAVGTMDMSQPPARINRITLRPRIVVAAGLDVGVVHQAIHDAHDECYIANSLRSEVVVEAEVVHA